MHKIVLNFRVTSEVSQKIDCIVRYRRKLRGFRKEYGEAKVIASGIREPAEALI